MASKQVGFAMSSTYFEVAKIKEKKSCEITKVGEFKCNFKRFVFYLKALVTKPTHNSSLKESSKLTTLVLTSIHSWYLGQEPLKNYAGRFLYSFKKWNWILHLFCFSMFFSFAFCTWCQTQEWHSPGRDWHFI